MRDHRHDEAGAWQRSRLRSLRRNARRRARDAWLNLRFAGGDERFFVSRHLAARPRCFDKFLVWLQTALPDVRRRFELHLLPCRNPDPSRYVLHLPWMQDPVEDLSQEAYDEAVATTERFAALGVPTINPVDRLVNASKSEGARRIRSAGLKTPETLPIEDPSAFRRDLLGLEPPLIVREDRGHGGKRALQDLEVVRIDTLAEAQRLDLTAYRRPVAAEWIDTLDPTDGLYHKYRYIAAGDLGGPYHIQSKDHWYVKGARTAWSEDLLARELEFLSRPDPHHEAFQAARRALELDFVCFDYSYMPDGEVVVWEANPLPYIQFLPGYRPHRSPAVARTFASMVHLYYTKAGLDVPDEVLPHLAYEHSGDLA